MLHNPVLLNDFSTLLKETPAGVDFFLDGTFGRGGHVKSVFECFPKARVVALDQDEQAIEYGQKFFSHKKEQKQIYFIHSNFKKINELSEQMNSILNGQKFSGILLDLGVSSPQLDDPERGFSFYKEGPLDMRMDLTQDFCAKDIVNLWSEAELIGLFKDLGEVRRPYRVVKRIIEERKNKAFKKTTDLSRLIEKTDGWRKKNQHPATQYFLALRLKVNRELEVVEESLPKMIQWLRDGGRLFVISFHSLEDRIVKYTLREQKDFGVLINKKVIQATREEKKGNLRARSAKLRVFERVGSA